MQHDYGDTVDNITHIVSSKRAKIKCTILVIKVTKQKQSQISVSSFWWAAFLMDLCLLQRQESENEPQHPNFWQIAFLSDMIFTKAR